MQANITGKKRCIVFMLLGSGLLLLAGCRRTKRTMNSAGLAITKKKSALPELDFPVINRTRKPWYIACFYWAKKIDLPVWRWYKSPVYRVEPGEEVIVDIDTFGNKRDRNDIYGWLAVFDNELDADVATWAAIPDEIKVQLNKLSSLKKKKNGKTVQYRVELTPERYGFYGNIIDYEINERNYDQAPKLSELDFWVENQTGDFLFTTAFVYQYHRGHMSWVHDAGNIVALPPGALRQIDVETIRRQYDWNHVHAHLGIFKTKQAAHPRTMLGQAHDEFTELAHEIAAEAEESSDPALLAAHEATYELLGAHQNIKLPRLKNLQGKKIVLRKKPYGLMVDRKHRPYSYFIEYTIENLSEDSEKNIFDEASAVEALSPETGVTELQELAPDE